MPCGITVLASEYGAQEPVWQTLLRYNTPAVRAAFGAFVGLSPRLGVWIC